MYKTLQRAKTIPGIIVQTQVCETWHGDQRLFAQGLQAVVLQQQRCEAPQALEGSLLHKGDLVLLQIQAGHAVVSEEDAFAEDFDAVAC